MAIKALLPVCLGALVLIGCAYNLGHRLGGDLKGAPPENTRESLDFLLIHNASVSNLRYLEMDIRESRDHKVFVFHDEDLQRMVPSHQCGNEMHWDPGRKEFVHYDSLEITRFNLNCDSVKIPTLSEVMQHIQDKNYRGRVYLEIKDLPSPEGRQAFLEVLTQYHNEIALSVIGFKSNLIAAYGNLETPCRQFKPLGIELLSVGWHTRLCPD